MDILAHKSDLIFLKHFIVLHQRYRKCSMILINNLTAYFSWRAVERQLYSTW